MSKKKKRKLNELAKYGYGPQEDDLESIIPASLIRGHECTFEAHWIDSASMLIDKRKLVRAYDHPEALLKLWVRKDPPLTQDEKNEVMAGIVRVLVPPGTSVEFALSGLNIYVNAEQVVWDNSFTRVAIENEGK
jgi:hypothetical protein